MSFFKLEQLPDGGYSISNITLVTHKSWVRYDAEYSSTGVLICAVLVDRNGLRKKITERQYVIWQRLQRFWYTHGPGRETHKTPPKRRRPLGLHLPPPPPPEAP
jgi:hypothetical protein